MRKLTVAVISTHPLAEGGVAHYTENLVQSLTAQMANVILLSNSPNAKNSGKTRDNDPKNLTIRICWKRGLFYPFQIFKEAARESMNVVHVQHEFFLFGGSFSALLFPMLLLLLKFLRKPIIVTLHGIIPLSEVNRQFLRENKLLNGRSTILKLGSVFCVKATLLLANAAVVHERCFVDLLRTDYKCEKKVVVIPHGIEKAPIKLMQNEAKAKLGLLDRTVILFFGYISQYKGLETLVEGFGQKAKEHKDWVLIIGGGENPRLKTNSSYRNCIQELRQKALTLAPHQTIFTGFLQEEELPVYFSAADLVVFPHKVAMSASGPLTFAIGYEKPVLLSRIPPFREMIDDDNAFFERNSPQSLAARLEFLMSNPEVRQRILLHFQKLADSFSWNNVGLETIRLYEKQLCETD